MNPPIGIVRIGTALGSQPLSNIEKYPGQTEAEYLVRTVGILETRRKKPGESAIDLCLSAFSDLTLQDDLELGGVELLVVVSQHTRPNIPPLSSILSGKLGLNENAYTLDLSIGCTGFVQGLHIVKSLMLELRAKNALLFNVETLSDVLDPSDKNTNFIFSDAASCTLVSTCEISYVPQEFNFGTSGQHCLALNALSSELRMDGLEIYKYVTSKVPKSIFELLNRSHVRASDLDFIFFHQASLRTVNKLKESFSEVRSFFDISDYGNTGSCSIPILLKAHREEILAGPNGRFVLSSFGSGLSFANCIVKTVYPF